jgi:hypothetical protein
MRLLKAIGILVTLIFMAFVAAAVVVTNFNQYVVLYRAETFARGRPYCIAVPDSKNHAAYVTATRFLDLSYNVMNARPVYLAYYTAYTFQYHAIILFEQPNELGHWSYWAENFVPNVDPGSTGQHWATDHRRECAPTLHFAEKLPR